MSAQSSSSKISEIETKVVGLERYVHEKFDEIRNSLEMLFNKLDGKSLTMPGILGGVSLILVFAGQFVGPLQSDISANITEIRELQRENEELRRALSVVNDRMLQVGAPSIFE